MRLGAQQLVASFLAAATLAGCAAPRASVMAMREIPPDQQERDRRDCEAQAGLADVTKPMSHTLLGAIGGALVGLGLGAVVVLRGAGTTNDPAEVAVYFGVAAAVGAGLGFLAGTAVGFSSGVRAAHDEYFTRYTECMRGRGYAVFRERR